MVSVAAKPEGWKQDNRRHYEAKVYGKASPGKNAMKPRYSLAPKKGNKKIRYYQSKDFYNDPQEAKRMEKGVLAIRSKDGLIHANLFNIPGSVQLRILDLTRPDSEVYMIGFPFAEISSYDWSSSSPKNIEAKIIEKLPQWLEERGIAKPRMFAVEYHDGDDPASGLQMPERFVTPALSVKDARKKFYETVEEQDGKGALQRFKVEKVVEEHN
jgi:hypothetical protein